MKYYVHHWRGRAREIPGVFQEGEPESPNHKLPYWMNIEDKDLGAKILELMKDYDVMLLSPTQEFPHARLCIDFKGYRFKQM